MSNIIDYLIQHPEVVWSGVGLFILTGAVGLFRFLKKRFDQHYKIIKINEYVDVEQLKKDLTYDNGIFIKNGTTEKFCSLCLDSNKQLIHLTEKKTSNGRIFECYHCGKIFLGADYDPNKGKSDSGFMTW